MTLSRDRLRTFPWVAQHLQMIWLSWHFFQAFCSTSWVLFSISRLDGVTNLVTLKAGSSYLENLKSSMPKTRAKNMMSRKFNFGLDVVKERKEYKNLGVTKNYAHSCSGNIDEAIKKTRHKGGMILSMGFDRKKVNPLVYIKLWKQICLLSLVFGSELWSLSNTDIACLERCQNWFIRKVFHLLLLKISGLISVENEIAKRKWSFIARMALSTSDTVLCKLFQARVRKFLTIQNNSFGFIKDVVFFMHKYSLSDYFDNWIRNRIFPSYFDWKRIVKSRIAADENNAYTEYASVHQDILLVPWKLFQRLFCFFLLPDWLKSNHLKSRMECGFSDIFPAIFVPP